MLLPKGNKTCVSLYIYLFFCTPLPVDSPLAHAYAFRQRRAQALSIPISPGGMEQF